MSAVSEPPAAPGPLDPPGGAAILCHTCGDPCHGEVLRVQSRYFHVHCFVCKACGCSLAAGGFFVRGGEHVCARDYRRLYGARCLGCGSAIEGEVVSALGRTFHPGCFVCAVCRLPFPPGDRVTFNGKECVCQKCTLPMAATGGSLSPGLWSCGGCGLEIQSGQSLVALGEHWHLGCFKCSACGQPLSAEFISRDGLPYCETDYHSKFGIRCDGCNKYITGHVLEAGEKHYHPQCALCVRCGRVFSEGEEMYLQGSSVWHPACRQLARSEDRSKETRTSSESIVSLPASSTSGSPSRIICAKLGDKALDYRDLAALPRSKAIYDIDRPDMISYSPYVSHAADRQGYEAAQVPSPTLTEGDLDDRSYKQCRTSSPSSTGSVSLGRYTPTSRSPQHYSRPGSESGRSTPSLSAPDGKPPHSTYQQAPRHFHVPDTGCKDNIYRKPPIYRQHGPLVRCPGSRLSGLMSALSLVAREVGSSRRLTGPSPLRPAACRPVDTEDSSFHQDSQKKSSWLTLKGDAVTRTDSPESDSRPVSQGSGRDRDTPPATRGDSLYSRCPYSSPEPPLGHGKNGLDHQNATVAPCGGDTNTGWGPREYKVSRTSHTCPGEASLLFLFVCCEVGVSPAGTGMSPPIPLACPPRPYPCPGGLRHPVPVPVPADLSLRDPHRHQQNPCETPQRRGQDEAGEALVAPRVPGGVPHE
ncbi:actin-binding LIM protein 2 isoform X3 [Erinaceus europaeus]|uniref:Actin-binding LIM protein 2 isoform X3 n=1 Tax=Erinaceus europaeus TaxID=9365 RepID=A0ABM3X6T1_ERIEU|nr:actin-binding LIM protein 2 isoform X3 [Erinaceus europaeus]